MVVWHVEFSFTCFSPFQPFQHEKGVCCIVASPQPYFVESIAHFVRHKGAVQFTRCTVQFEGSGHGLQDAGGGMLSLISELQTGQQSLCFAHAVMVH